MREIEQAVKRLQQGGVNLRGLLFNDVNMRSPRYGAGKYSYEYATEQPMGKVRRRPGNRPRCNNL